MTGATVHASAVLLGEAGILVSGRSGSGKSSLVLAVLQAFPDSARLVADDRVVLNPAGGRLLAFVPDQLAGLIEIRGVGIVHRPFISPVVLRLVVALDPLEACPRLPEPDEEKVTLSGVTLPRLILPEGTVDPQRISFVLSRIREKL